MESVVSVECRAGQSAPQAIGCSECIDGEDAAVVIADKPPTLRLTLAGGGFGAQNGFALPLQRLLPTCWSGFVEPVILPTIGVRHELRLGPFTLAHSTNADRGRPFGIALTGIAQSVCVELTAAGTFGQCDEGLALLGLHQPLRLIG